MAKAVFGEYAAYTTPGGIRFMKNAKLASKASIPLEVQVYLERSLTGGERGQVEEGQSTPAPTRPVLTDEQKAQLRAESLAVKPELQASPEKLAEDAAALTSADFDVPQVTIDSEPPRPVDPSPPETEAVTTTENFPEPTPQPLAEATPTEDLVSGSDFLESVSIHTAALEDIAEALFERFGIYTVWLKRLPNPDEVNPLTGDGFSKYHHGIAYQAAIRAQNQGLLNLDPTHTRKVLDEGRKASAHYTEQFEPQAVTLGENRRANTFAYRTAPMGTREVATTEIVHEMGSDGQMHAVQRAIVNGEETETGAKNGARVGYKADEDEPIVEPNFSGKPIIRPDW